MCKTVIVIGLGCVGSAVAMQLAKRGARVIGLEQFEFGHERGSSSHQSRAFRLAYAEHEGYVPLLKRARDLWIELNNAFDETVFYETGGLYLSNKKHGLVQDSIQAAELYDLPHEVLDADDIRKRFPMFAVTDQTSAMYEPLAGFIVPEIAIAGNLALAISRGADLREHVKVLAWQETEDGVEVETDQGLLVGDKLVICKGAWTEEVHIRPSRQVLTWWESVVDTTGLPVWSIELEDDTWLYGFPEVKGLIGPQGSKVARHYPADTVDPDNEDEKSPVPEDQEDVSPYLQEWIPELAKRCLETRTCMYGNSKEGHFRIGMLPDHKHVVVIAGLSGHGFKFQPVLGEIGADLALIGETSHNIKFLHLP